MRILDDYPPMWSEIAKTFGDLNLQNNKPIFCWGPIIFNPFRHPLQHSSELIAHENMHSLRQIGLKAMEEYWPTPAQDAKIRLWWRDYLESASFRLEEEIPAHRAEYRHLLREKGNTRPMRRHWLNHVAKRLRSPLYKYDHLFSLKQAKAWLELDETEMKGE